MRRSRRPHCYPRKRADISIALVEFDRPVESPGVVKLEITAPSQLLSYDRAALDDLAGQLVVEGHQEIVEGTSITHACRVGPLAKDILTC